MPTVNVADVPPFGTVTEAGTQARLLDDQSAIDAPPSGAAAESVTVAITESPPVVVSAVSVSDEMAPVATATASVAVADVLPSVAVIVTVAFVALVVTENVVLVKPAGMLTVAGTVAAAELLASVTVVPPVGAAVFVVTVPVTVVAPDTDDDESETDNAVVGPADVIVFSHAAVAAMQHTTMAHRITQRLCRAMKAKLLQECDESMNSSYSLYYASGGAVI